MLLRSNLNFLRCLFDQILNFFDASSIKPQFSSMPLRSNPKFLRSSFDFLRCLFDFLRLFFDASSIFFVHPSIFFDTPSIFFDHSLRCFRGAFDAASMKALYYALNRIFAPNISLILYHIFLSGYIAGNISSRDNYFAACQIVDLRYSGVHPHTSDFVYSLAFIRGQNNLNSLKE